MNHQREQFLTPLRAFGIYISERKKALREMVDQNGNPEALGEYNAFLKLNDRYMNTFDAVIKVLEDWGF